jgi:YfiH family protein
MHHNNIIKSKIFNAFPEIIMGISTRHGGISPEPLGMNLCYTVGDNPENVRKNRDIFFNSLGISSDQVVFQRQTHSTNVKFVNAPGVHESCDALITRTSGIFLAVSLADCLPILVYDPINKIVAGVHAGWRGSRDRIVLKVLEKLINDYGSRPSGLIAYIGPGAGTCCYEVGGEVANQFSTDFLIKNGNGRTYLDLKSFNQGILISTGIPSSQIEVSDYCTICNPDIFHSYRRDKGRSGRMLAIIGMKN